MILSKLNNDRSRTSLLSTHETLLFENISREEFVRFFPVNSALISLTSLIGIGPTMRLLVHQRRF